MAGRWRAILILALMAAASLLTVGLPMWLIQPFRPQTPRGLEVSFLLRKWAPIATLAFAGFALFCCLKLWRSSPGLFRRTIMLLLVVLSILPAWVTRQNLFEKMFHPIASPFFARAEEASFLESGDRVMGVELNGEAAAYPIRALAYHHLVNDVVGGVPIVATY
jgi:Protein of unknown function (DUF3179)